MDPQLYEKYSRQILFAGIGEEGRAAVVRRRTPVLVGCGVWAPLLPESARARGRLASCASFDPILSSRRTCSASRSSMKPTRATRCRKRSPPSAGSAPSTTGVQVEGIVA